MASGLKRFYKTVTVERAQGDGFEVKLDGRSLRTPAKQALLLPAEALADEIAAEWQAQGDEIRPAEMPFMSLACTAVDHVAPRRMMVVEEVAAFGGHDLICYWADGQPDLVDRQQQTWQPLLDWAAVTFDAPLVVVRGVLPQAQPDAAEKALRLAVDAHDDLSLAALAAATQAAGSLVIGLALLKGQLSVEEAVEASQLDELYQVELWGEDHEAKARREALAAELSIAARFAAHLRRP